MTFFKFENEKWFSKYFKIKCSIFVITSKFYNYFNIFLKQDVTLKNC